MGFAAKRMLQSGTWSSLSAEGGTISYLLSSDGFNAVEYKIHTFDDSGVSMLLRMDGANNSQLFTDSSTNNIAVNNIKGVKVSTANKVFGTGSAFLTGNGAYLESLDNIKFNFRGNDDFTIESWVYFKNLSNIVPIASKGSSTGWTFYYNNGTLTFGTPSSPNDIFVTSFIPALSSWYHFACSRTSGILRLFVNGIYVAETTTPVTKEYFSTETLKIGRSHGGSPTYLNGYLDEFRITKGYSQYPTNDTFYYLLTNQHPTPTLPAFDIVKRGTENAVEYLVIGGGGSGGFSTTTVGAGGGGAGGVVTNINSTKYKVTVQSYPVIVGSGATRNSIVNGLSSSVFDVIAIGGGRGGSTTTSLISGAAGGSGGGAYPGGTGGTGFQGSQGGLVANASWTAGAGGGGYSQIGSNPVTSLSAGKGGDGIYTTFRTLIGEWFAGGGGGGTYSSTLVDRGRSGLGSSGAGGYRSTAPSDGVIFGAGGGGAGNSGINSGAGGSGAVMIRYPFRRFYGAQPAATGAFTTNDITVQNKKYRVFTFTGNGTFITKSPIYVDYLLVGGGGGSNFSSSGGGGGGGIIYGNTLLNGATNYQITVGIGGKPGYSPQDLPPNFDNITAVYATSGSNTIFLNLTAFGGGYGGQYNVPYLSGSRGSSGGGGAGGNNITKPTFTQGGVGITNQGFKGASGDSLTFNAGGGGGAGGAGGVIQPGAPSTGGVGISNDITGSTIFYGGGGAGGTVTGTPLEGGVGGGGRNQVRGTGNLGNYQGSIVNRNNNFMTVDMPNHIYQVDDYGYMISSTLPRPQIFKVTKVFTNSFEAVTDSIGIGTGTGIYTFYRSTARDGADGFGGGAGGSGGELLINNTVDGRGRFGGSGVVIIRCPLYD